MSIVSQLEVSRFLFSIPHFLGIFGWRISLASSRESSQSSSFHFIFSFPFICCVCATGVLIVEFGLTEVNWLADDHGPRIYRDPDVWGEDSHTFNPDRWLTPRSKRGSSVGVYSNL